VETLNEPVTILSFQEVAIGTGSDAQAICIVSIEDKEEGQRCYGVGISRNTTTTALNAVISAMNRRWGKA
jgi:2-isopropylmalate synthase